MNCLNCGNNINETLKYCAHCGQKTKRPKLSVWAIIADFISNVFNFDAKIYKTIAHLFIPGKLTRAYVNGARQKYYPPIRILFFTMVVFFGLLASAINDALPDFRKFANENHRITVENDVFAKIDSLAPIYAENQCLPGLDSIKQNYTKRNKSVRDTFLLHGEQFLNIKWSEEKILVKDVYDLNAQEIFEKYKIEGKKKRMVVSVVLKFYTKPEGIPPFLIGNTLWSVIISIFFTGFIMKLLFIRKKKKYVEHLVFLMHTHCASFLFISLILLIAKIFGYAIIDNNSAANTTDFRSAAFLNLAVMVPMIFFLIAMFMYYKQGVFKTLFKYTLIGFSYVMIASLVTLFVSAISLVVF